MTKHSPGLTTSVEDYLKAIYRISESGQPASTNDIAEALQLAPPSVSGMVKRLAEHGLVEHLPYHGVTLTAAGKLGALRILRRHRLIEAYLVQFLDYTWDTVHDEAERLEHAVSDDLVARMAEALGNPRVDPHGDPIPSAEGEIDPIETHPLTEAEIGERVRINRVASGSGEKLRWLADAGLVPGAEVTVTAQQPFSGPLTLEVDGEERIVGREIAGQLRCVRAES